jgi:hypothetical protein
MNMFVILLYDFSLFLIGYFSRFKVDATGRRTLRFPVALLSFVHSVFFMGIPVFKVIDCGRMGG